MFLHLSVNHFVHGRRASMADGCVVEGGVVDRGTCMAVGCPWQGVCIAGGVCARGMYMHGRRDGHCSGRHTSYLNGFFLAILFENYIKILLVVRLSYYLEFFVIQSINEKYEKKTPILSPNQNIVRVRVRIAIHCRMRYYKY